MSKLLLPLTITSLQAISSLFFKSRRSVTVYMCSGWRKPEHTTSLLQSYDLAEIMYDGGVLASFNFWQKKVIKLVCYWRYIQWYAYPKNMSVSIHSPAKCYVIAAAHIWQPCSGRFKILQFPDQVSNNCTPWRHICNVVWCMQSSCIHDLSIRGF